jgi:hypothetical protein
LEARLPSGAASPTHRDIADMLRHSDRRAFARIRSTETRPDLKFGVGLVARKYLCKIGLRVINVFLYNIVVSCGTTGDGALSVYLKSASADWLFEAPERVQQESEEMPGCHT